MTLSFAPERIETWPLAKLQPYAKNAKVLPCLFPAGSGEGTDALPSVWERG